MRQHINAVLFDLDGTLLPMNQETFLKAYFSALTQTLAPYGYEPESLMNAMWCGIKAMLTNNGSQTNEDAFWTCMRSIYGGNILRDLPLFDEFYRTNFEKAKKACGYQPLSAEVVRNLHKNGFRVILATSPVFPEIATHARIRWAGLEPGDFEWITTFENSRHCKPDPAYYTDLAHTLKLSPAECLMIGNDVRDDMAAETVGMQVFLLTDCLIDSKGQAESYPHGNFAELVRILNHLIAHRNGKEKD